MSYIALRRVTGTRQVRNDDGEPELTKAGSPRYENNTWQIGERILEQDAQGWPNVEQLVRSGFIEREYIPFDRFEALEARVTALEALSPQYIQQEGEVDGSNERKSEGRDTRTGRASRDRTGERAGSSS